MKKSTESHEYMISFPVVVSENALFNFEVRKIDMQEKSSNSKMHTEKNWLSHPSSGNTSIKRLWQTYLAVPGHL